jgi:hypothetical protein
MDVFPSFLTGAARAARDDLSRLAAQTAQAASGPPGGETRRMAAAARAAVFADALLGAVRARAEEFRTATR